jgi:hypothetical protein
VISEQFASGKSSKGASLIFGREASFILAPAEFGIVGVTSSKHVWE